MKLKRLPFQTVAVLVALLSGMLVLGVSRTDFIRSVEPIVLDRLLVDRYRVFGVRPVDSRILVVEIDQALFQGLKKPSVFWYREYAELIGGLTRSGAVVGLDLILEHQLEGVTGVAGLEGFLEHVEEGMTQLRAEFLSGGAVLATDMDDYATGDRFTPLEAAAYAAPIGGSPWGVRHNLCAINIRTDSDGIVRSMPIKFDQEGAPVTFAGRLAEMVAQRPLRREGREIYFGQERVLTHGPDGDLLYLNFPGPGRTTFASVSAWSLLGELRHYGNLDRLRGKVCLIAPQDDSFYDDVNTAFLLLGRGSTPKGVETHATTLNSLLTGDYIRTLGFGATAALLLLLSLGAGAAAANFRPQASLAAVALFGGLTYGFGIWALHRNLWLPVFTLVLGLFLAWLQVLVLRFLTVERARRRTERLFGRMVSEQVMQAVLASPEARRLGGTRRPVSVLFSDINDFTPKCERHEPEEVIAMLNDYFREMIDVVNEEDGNLKQFVGDEIMAIYGAPMPYPDHAARAVRTAFKMQQRLARLKSADLGGEAGFYEVAIGIHSGEVVVGQVGSDRRSEYAAVGDDVNLGARIMGVTKKLGKKILVSHATQAQCKEQLPEFEFVSVGVHSFKGKTGEMELFEVLEKKA